MAMIVDGPPGTDTPDSGAEAGRTGSSSQAPQPPRNWLHRYRQRLWRNASRSTTICLSTRTSSSSAASMVSAAPISPPASAGRLVWPGSPARSGLAPARSVEATVSDWRSPRSGGRSRDGESVLPGDWLSFGPSAAQPKQCPQRADNHKRASEPHTSILVSLRTGRREEIAAERCARTLMAT
jgi:hypothetical protein